jgi:8-oxo-dGTP diphosphatase
MPTPKVGVGVLVIENGRVLLGKRKGSHGAGTWSAPGGHLEYGESIENCAEREVLEETGISIRDLQYGPFTNNVFESEQKHYVTVFVLAKRGSGVVETKEPEKCEGWEWFDWSNLPEPLFSPLETLRRQSFTLPDGS